MITLKHWCFYPPHARENNLYHLLWISLLYVYYGVSSKIGTYSTLFCKDTLEFWIDSKGPFLFEIIIVHLKNVPVAAFSYKCFDLDQDFPSINEIHSAAHSYFLCHLKVKKELLVTLSKSGEKDRLLVDLIDIYTISPDKKITELERFQCKKFDVGGAKLPKETKKCQTGPYHYQQIEKAIFQMDKDGTDDSVTFKIASDSNNVTCSAKLSHTFSDDWRKDKLETWLRTDFGDCRTKLYKVRKITARLFKSHKTVR